MGCGHSWSYWWNQCKSELWDQVPKAAEHLSGRLWPCARVGTAVAEHLLVWWTAISSIHSCILGVWLFFKCVFRPSRKLNVSKARLGLEQPGLVEAAPAQGSRVEPDDFLRSLPSQTSLWSSDSKKLLGYIHPDCKGFQLVPLSSCHKSSHQKQPVLHHQCFMSIAGTA